MTVSRGTFYWLFNEQINSTFGKQLNSVFVHGVSGMDSSELIGGRPYGGCAILWKKGFACSVQPVKLISNRACAISVTVDNVNLILCNTYMPCDTNYDQTNSEEFESTLEAISQMLQAENADYLVLGGDFNTDFGRAASLHTAFLNNFIQQESLRRDAEHISCSKDYTFESKITGVRSNIDHFMVTDNLFDHISRCYVVNDADNMSDHCPVSLILSLETLYNQHESTQASCKLKW